MRRNADRKVAPMPALPHATEPTPDPRADEGAPASTHGWNAYEVWRTRVLIPAHKSTMPAKQSAHVARFTKK
jgi:hypothetical protein